MTHVHMLGWLHFLSYYHTAWYIEVGGLESLPAPGALHHQLTAKKPYLLL
jgi:hypothetical protein